MHLEQILAQSDFITTDCIDPHKEIPLQPKDERSVSMSNLKTYQFWLFLICIALASTFASSEFTMADTACYESVRGTDFGQQRLWAAIGWGSMAFFAGYLNDYTKGYMAAWVVLACLTSLQIWNTYRMNLVKPAISQNSLKDLKIIFSSLEFLCFGTGVLLNGMLTGVIWYYLTWFIVSIGGNKLIIGLVHGIECFFGEVPALYISGWLLKKLGHFNMVSLAIIGHAFRFFYYSFLQNPWWILPIECLHGITYGSFIAAMTSYAKSSSTPGTEATTQSVLCSIFEGLGCGSGCVITGICLEYFGGHTTFFYISFFCVVAATINLLATFAVRRRKSAQDTIKPAASGERY